MKRLKFQADFIKKYGVVRYAHMVVSSHEKTACRPGDFKGREKVVRDSLDGYELEDGWHSESDHNLKKR